MDDPDRFRRESRRSWGAVAAGWGRHAPAQMASVMPVTTWMLDAVDLQPGFQVLELAAGPGDVGFLALELIQPGGSLITSDFSPEMLSQAQARAEALGLDGVRFKQIDAESIDLDAGSIDAVLCRWGYMLMADPKAAFVETRRVLRHGGRLSCAVVAEAEQNPWVALPSGVLQEHGHMPPPQAAAPGILALADRDRLRRLFAGAGFSEPHLDEVAFVWRFRDPDEYWAFLTGVFGGIAMVVDRLDYDERERVREEVAARVRSFSSASTIEFPAVSLVASAS